MNIRDSLGGKLEDGQIRQKHVVSNNNIYNFIIILDVVLTDSRLYAYLFEYCTPGCNL
jgi:hypothetical protein